MSAIAIITARGGSKRIPKKNIKDFCGKPVIAYGIEAALQSGCFDEVMVSTDSREIARTAEKYGASVPFFRSSAASTDYATTADVLAEVLQQYKRNGKEFTLACCIYPTAPFLKPGLLKQAVELLQEKQSAQAVFTVTAYSYPPQRGLVVRRGVLEMREPGHKTARSQDLETVYHDAGQFYLFRPADFMESGDLWAGEILPLILKEMEVQDIDTAQDWALAEMKYRLCRG